MSFTFVELVDFARGNRNILFFDRLMSSPGKRTSFFISRFVRERKEQQVPKGNWVAIASSKLHRRKARIVALVLVSPRCQQEAHDFQAAILGRNMQRRHSQMVTFVLVSTSFHQATHECQIVVLGCLLQRRHASTVGFVLVRGWAIQPSKNWIVHLLVG